jgi:hypothetical protein
MVIFGGMDTVVAALSNMFVQIGRRTDLRARLLADATLIPGAIEEFLRFEAEPGATKTSAAYAVRSIIDPNASPLRTKPKDPHDVFVAGTHSLIVGYKSVQPARLVVGNDLRGV